MRENFLQMGPSETFFFLFSNSISQVYNESGEQFSFSNMFCTCRGLKTCYDLNRKANGSPFHFCRSISWNKNRGKLTDFLSLYHGFTLFLFNFFDFSVMFAFSLGSQMLIFQALT